MERRRFLSNDELPDNFGEVLEQVFKDIVYNEFKGLGFITAEIVAFDNLEDNYFSLPFIMYTKSNSIVNFSDDNTVDDYADIRDYAMRRILLKLTPIIKHSLLEQYFPNYICFVESTKLNFTVHIESVITEYELRLTVIMRVEDISD